jgi:hypothetical protein
MTPEGQIKETICLWLSLQKGFDFWVTQSVGIYDSRKKCYRKPSKWFKPGQTDVWGFCPDNRPFWIEIKVPGKKPSKPQQEFLANVNSRGHIGFVAYSLDDVLKNLSP